MDTTSQLDNMRNWEASSSSIGEDMEAAIRNLWFCSTISTQFFWAPYRSPL